MKKHPILKTAPDPDYPPFEFLDDNNEPAGITVDVLKLISKKTGIKFEHIKVDSWTESMRMAREGETDLLSTITKTMDRSEYLSFTPSYIDVPDIILVRRDVNTILKLKDLEGKTVGTVRDWAANKYALDNYPLIRFKYETSVKAVLEELSMGSVDAAILNLGAASYWVQKLNVTNLKIAGETGFVYHLSFACRKEQPTLFSIMEKAVNSLTQEEKKAIFNKWIFLQSSGWEPDPQLMVFIAGVLVFFSFCGILIWNRSLRNKVYEKTIDIQAQLSERERIQEALHLNEQKFRALTENSIDIILIFNKDGYFDYASPSVKAFGFQPEDLVDKHPVKFVHPEDLEILREAFLESLQKPGETIRMDDIRIRTSQDDWVDVEGILTSLLDMPGVEGVVFNGRDVTDRKKLEKRVQQTQKLESLGTVAGGIAHDFNNLLLGILGNAELAASSVGADSPIIKNLDQIKHLGQKAAELTKQMLDYSGRGSIKKAAVNLSKIIFDMSELLKSSVGKNAVLDFKLNQIIYPIKADQDQVKQVVLDLVTNASEALENEKGRITVSTDSMFCNDIFLHQSFFFEDQHEGYYTFVQVSDTGCGMPADVIDKIFDPFYSTKFTGRGLGLAAVSGIVRGHHGFIRVGSLPGRGSVFTVFFPSEMTEAAVQPEKQAVRPVDMNNLNVLVVDDEEQVLEVVTEFLDMNGIRFKTARDGLEAVRLFSSAPDEFDIVLLDLTMPEMDGREAFKEIRKIRSDIPIVIASGYSEEELAEHFAQKNNVYFMQKPFQFKQLENAISLMLGVDTRDAGR